jgi:hypothetical protein
MSVLLLVPTRGRPEKARECWMMADGNAIMPDTQIMFVIDPDDDADYSVPTVTVKSEGGGMGPPLNAAVRRYWDDFDVIGFIGDDHRIRTLEWDKIVGEHLKRPGMLYGNDKSRTDIPTQVFMSSVIVKTLGWMALPGAKHLYLDNTWARLGRGADCLIYDEKLIIEHMHPTLGKAENDDGYKRVNAPAVYSHDGKVFERWQVASADADIEKVKAVL